jgi:hypothetical protein
MLFTNSVRTSKRTPHFTITNINWLTLFKFKQGCINCRPYLVTHELITATVMHEQGRGFVVFPSIQLWRLSPRRTKVSGSPYLTGLNSSDGADLNDIAEKGYSDTDNCKAWNEKLRNINEKGRVE